MSVRTLWWSALLTGVFRVIVVVPVHKTLCGETDQGRVMHLALQVGAKAFSRGAGGLAIMVKLSLIIPGGIAIAVAACLPLIRRPRGMS